uniref:Uncharacterized protein n=1 Tax=Rhizophora mucronata TaxID=61149 RepID=A0A2P2MQ22_RHIMU
MNDEDSGLHGHQFVKLFNDLIIGGYWRNGTPVRDTDINCLQIIDQVRYDSLPIFVVDVDGHNFFPSKGLDHGAYGMHLSGIILRGSKEIWMPSGSEGRTGCRK